MNFSEKDMQRDSRQNPTITAIRDLITAYTDAAKPNEEYEALRAPYVEKYDMLRATVSQEQEKLLDAFTDAADEMQTMFETQAFILGFKTAFRLFAESLT